MSENHLGDHAISPVSELDNESDNEQQFEPHHRRPEFRHQADSFTYSVGNTTAGFPSQAGSEFGSFLSRGGSWYFQPSPSPVNNQVSCFITL
jgi:hypothetical protein